MNIVKENAGKINIFGNASSENEAEWKKKVGYAGELLEAYHFLKITEIKNLIARWYPNWNEEQFEQLVRRYQIDVDERFGKCSKGTKKKVDFIFALCHNPSLLLLDEPSAGVDLVSKRKMKEDLIRFMEDGERSILLATHTVDEINQLCDEIIVLDTGRMVHAYNKDDIYDKWARVWVSGITDKVKSHPNVIQVETTPPQLVTDNLLELEKALQGERVTIHHVGRLAMEEILEYLIEQDIDFD